MLIWVYMMTAVASPLEGRLERLTGEEAACCVPVYTHLADEARASPRYRRTLDRARALADDRRLLALTLLQREGELCACELQAALGVSHATVSHHMGVLVAAGLVKTERRGKWVYYRALPAKKALVP